MLRSSTNKEKAFEFLEFLNTYEGQLLQTLGVEGHDYKREGDVFTLTEIGKSHAMDHGVVVPKDMSWVNPVSVPKNFAEAQKIVMEYGQPELFRSTSDNAKEIITKYGVRAIMGAISGEDAVKTMQSELKSKNYID